MKSKRPQSIKVDEVELQFQPTAQKVLETEGNENAASQVVESEVNENANTPRNETERKNSVAEAPNSNMKLLGVE